MVAGAKEGRKTLQAFASRFNPGGLSGGAGVKPLLRQLDALKCDPSCGGNRHGVPDGRSAGGRAGPHRFEDERSRTMAKAMVGFLAAGLSLGLLAGCGGEEGAEETGPDRPGP